MYSLSANPRGTFVCPSPPVKRQIQGPGLGFLETLRLSNSSNNKGIRQVKLHDALLNERKSLKSVLALLMPKSVIFTFHALFGSLPFFIRGLHVRV